MKSRHVKYCEGLNVQPSCCNETRGEMMGVISAQTEQKGQRKERTEDGKTSF